MSLLQTGEVGDFGEWGLRFSRGVVEALGMIWVTVLSLYAGRILTTETVLEELNFKIYHFTCPTKHETPALAYR